MVPFAVRKVLADAKIGCGTILALSFFPESFL
jgi:hypothetical protein